MFSGFLLEDDFVTLMAEAVCVVDLSLKPDCLVCGAYEALTLGQAAVLSDSKAARYFFSDGFEFVDNSAVQIADAILRILKDRDGYRGGVQIAADRYRGIWMQHSIVASEAIWGSRSLVK